MFFRIPFRVKLALLFVLALIFSIVAIASFAVYSSSNAIEHDQKIALSEITNLVTTNVTRMVKSLNRQVEDLSESEAVRNFSEAPDIDRLKSVQAAAASMVRSFRYVKGLYLVYGQKVYLPLENRVATTAAESLSPLLDSLQQHSAEIVWESAAQALFPEDPHESERCIRVVKSMKRGPEKESNGLLILELSHREFLPLLLSNQVSLYNQYHLIFDRNMEIITANRSFDEEANDRILNGLRQDVGTITLGRPAKRYFVKQQYEGLTGWTVACVQPASAAFPSGSELMRLVAQFAGITALLTSLLVVFITGTVTRPIRAIGKAMKKFEEGDFSVRVHPRGTDEMGQLMRSFNYMANEIDRLIHEVYLAQLSYKEAKLSALQAQINPHFLYNTLDSMQWLLLSHGELEVAGAIVALGDVFRYSTDTDEQFVRLEQEMSFMDDYLKIQKFRLEDKLQFVWKIPENLRELYLPRLILQPLIENAIKYGQEDDGKIYLEIQAGLAADTLEISVTDHGKGFDEAMRSEILTYMESADASPEKHGLRNVHKRLRLLFGEKAGVRLSSETGKSSTFSISLPQLEESPGERSFCEVLRKQDGENTR